MFGRHYKLRCIKIDSKFSTKRDVQKSLSWLESLWSQKICIGSNPGATAVTINRQLAVAALKIVHDLLEGQSHGSKEMLEFLTNESRELYRYIEFKDLVDPLLRLWRQWESSTFTKLRSSFLFFGISYGMSQACSYPMCDGFLYRRVLQTARISTRTVLRIF